MSDIPEVVLVRRFPAVGPLMHEAYEDLRHAGGPHSLALVQHFGPVEELPRPWDVTTCEPAELRLEVWTWLDAVVDWLNTEHGWLGEDHIPSCWPRHPHLVHALGTLADQRRRADIELTSGPLEEWHRYSLPAFHEHLHTRLKGACETGHTGPAGVSRTERYRSEVERDRRQSWYRADALAATGSASPPRIPPRLLGTNEASVAPRTGEIL